MQRWRSHRKHGMETLSNRYFSKPCPTPHRNLRSTMRHVHLCFAMAIQQQEDKAIIMSLLYDSTYEQRVPRCGGRVSVSMKTDKRNPTHQASRKLSTVKRLATKEARAPRSSKLDRANYSSRYDSLRISPSLTRAWLSWFSSCRISTY